MQPHRVPDLMTAAVRWQRSERSEDQPWQCHYKTPRSEKSLGEEMRWFWIDRFLEFQSGQMAKAVKNVSLSEEHMHDHFPGFPIMPCSLIMEGMAQTGGILLGESHQFKYLVFLAKVPKFTSHRAARPGDQLTYTATLVDNRDEGGMTNVTAHCGDELVAEAEIVFAFLAQDDESIPVSARQNNVVESGLAAMLHGVMKK